MIELEKISKTVKSFVIVLIFKKKFHKYFYIIKLLKRYIHSMYPHEVTYLCSKLTTVRCHEVM